MVVSTLKLSLFFDVKNQLLTVFYVNIGALSMGCGIGWLSPALKTLQSDQSPLRAGALDVDEISWLGSMINIGGLIGVIFLSGIGNYFGNKIAITVSAIPNILSWVLIYFSTTIVHLYVSQIAIGFSLGGLYVLIPLMVTEIADERVRGIFGSVLTVFQYSGILLAYCVGSYIPYHYVPCVMVVLPVLFLLCMVCLVPESPQFLLSRNRVSEAESSLRFYKNYSKSSKGDTDRLQCDFLHLKDIIKQKQEISSNMKMRFRNFCVPEARRGLLIGLTLMTLYVFNGTLIFLAYASVIFLDSGTIIDENLSSIIVAAIQIAGSLVAIFLIDMIGRRFLLIVSSIGCTFGLSAMGAYNYCLANGLDVSEWYWVPLTSLSLTFFTACIGMMPLAFVILAEVLPVNIRSSGSTICMAYVNLLLFAMLKAFPLMMKAFNLYVCMWIFAGACLMGIPFSIFVVKETKGITVNQLKVQQ